MSERYRSDRQAPGTAAMDGRPADRWEQFMDTNSALTPRYIIWRMGAPAPTPTVPTQSSIGHSPWTGTDERDRTASGNANSWT